MSIYLLPQHPKRKTFTITTNVGISISFNSFLSSLALRGLWVTNARPLPMGVSQLGNGLRTIIRLTYQKSLHTHTHTYTRTHTQQGCLVFYHNASLKACLYLWGHLGGNALCLWQSPVYNHLGSSIWVLQQQNFC